MFGTTNLNKYYQRVFYKKVKLRDLKVELMAEKKITWHISKNVIAKYFYLSWLHPASYGSQCQNTSHVNEEYYYVYKLSWNVDRHGAIDTWHELMAINNEN